MKFLLKEQFVPASVNKLYFNLAPILAMVPALVTVAVIPFAPGFDLRPIASWLATPMHWGEATVQAFQISGVVANLDVGLLFGFCGYLPERLRDYSGRMGIEFEISVSWGNSLLCSNYFL